MAILETSKKYRLKWLDFLKGALLATVTPVLFLIQESLAAGELKIDWKHLGMVALGTFLAYLTKNLLTPSQVILTGEDINKAVPIIEQAKVDAATANKTELNENK